MNNSQLENSVAETIRSLLLPYLENFHNYRIDAFPGEVVVKGQVDDKETSRTLVLKVLINHNDKQILIPNIFMPEFMRHHGIGKRAISMILGVAESHGYDLFIVDLVRSFYDRLVKRGAIVCEENEVVLITRETDLSHNYA
ncbi:hypothetical protein [Zoogloea sp.]|jgi:hypothetical protein|uniref:hypothetical protein n=1 Tax=Zoogloea sp. TaxID=49181 RepID=UPI00260E3DC9|nr:hypothetical protein [Zoogloea sp.]